MRFAIVIEQAEGNYSAYVPDLPGCVATGAMVADVEREICDAARRADRAFAPGRFGGQTGLIRSPKILRPGDVPLSVRAHPHGPRA